MTSSINSFVLFIILFQLNVFDTIMSNKLTLLIDSNWLLQSRFSVLSKGFVKSNPDTAKEQASTELQELLARSICVILNRFPIIDNIIFVADGGSWRKQLQIPSQLKNITYKGNRSQDCEMDWHYIYGALNSMLNAAKGQEITVSQYPNIEGDDWIWYWSRRLNADGTNCLIWSSDNDLKQLIQVDKNTNAFTAWYNDRNGLWLHNTLQEETDPITFFMKLEYFSPVLDQLRAKVNDINYIDPDTIITSKVICGDAGDNIMPIIRYQKGTRNHRITENDWGKISNKYNLLSIKDLVNNENGVARVILEDDKFTKLINESLITSSIGDIAEMIEYNIKLVWLHESIIPDTIIQFMNQQDYLKCNVQYIKNNYKTLIEQDNQILDLFNSL